MFNGNPRQNQRRQESRSLAACTGEGTTAYEYADYTISISGNGVVGLYSRNGGAPVEEIDLNSQYAIMSGERGDFTLIGKGDVEKDEPISNTDASGNAVTLDTAGNLQNIGLQQPYSIVGRTVAIGLDEGTLYFWLQPEK